MDSIQKKREYLEDHAPVLVGLAETLPHQRHDLAVTLAANIYMHDQEDHDLLTSNRQAHKHNIFDRETY